MDFPSSSSSSSFPSSTDTSDTPLASTTGSRSRSKTRSQQRPLSALYPSPSDSKKPVLHARASSYSTPLSAVMRVVSGATEKDDDEKDEDPSLAPLLSSCSPDCSMSSPIHSRTSSSTPLFASNPYNLHSSSSSFCLPFFNDARTGQYLLPRSGKAWLRPRSLFLLLALFALSSSVYIHTFHPEQSHALARVVIGSSSSSSTSPTNSENEVGNNDETWAEMIQAKLGGLGDDLVSLDSWSSLTSGREGLEGRLPLSPWNRFTEGPWKREREDLSLREFDSGTNDGRLLIKEGKQHPIPLLMARAKMRWAQLQSRQSKNFAQAVKEYERRYGRHPPKGFDRWYAFARAHNVRMIDEFDIIEHSLRPFRAFSAASFRARADRTQTFDNTWGIRFSHGKIYREGLLGHHNRAKGVVSMCEKFKHELSDMFIGYNSHDGARINLNWEERMRLEDLVEQGITDPFDGKNEKDKELKPKIDAPAPGWGVPQTCAQTDKMREEEWGYEDPDNGMTGTEILQPPDGAIGTLVDSFKGYFDTCNSPQYRHFHSSTSWAYQTWPTPLLPLFTPGVHNRFADVYCIITEQFSDTFEESIPWSERESLAVWVGQASGALYDANTPWQSTQRPRLHLMSRDKEGKRDVVLADEEGNARRRTVKKKDINPKFFDTGIVGPAEQCVIEDGTCAKIPTILEPYHERMTFDEQNQYKYLLDIDGNSWSGRFRRLMLSNGAVLKATIFQEFWTDWAIPWLHFIPVQVDYSDLWDVMAFFRGGPNGEGAHDHLAEEIGEAGREWAKTHMRNEDIEAFTFRQLLEYGRLYNADREDMDFILEVEDYEPIWYQYRQF